MANSCPMRKKATEEAQKSKLQAKVDSANKPITEAAKQAAQATVTATQNAWKPLLKEASQKAWQPLINEVRQEIKREGKDKKEPTIILQLPNDLSTQVYAAILTAHIKNMLNPELGFRHHTQEVLKANGLPHIDLGEGDTWGLLRVIPPTPNTRLSESNSHIQALEEQQDLIASTPRADSIEDPEFPPLAVRSRDPRLSHHKPTPMAPPPSRDSSSSRSKKHKRHTQTQQHTQPQTQTKNPQPHHTPANTSTDSYTSTSPPAHLHRDGYPLLPQAYGMRFFATEPSHYTNLTKDQIAHQINQRTIKWTYTNTKYKNIVHEQKITDHLLAGHILADGKMVEKLKTATFKTLQNGWDYTSEANQSADTSTQQHTR